MFFLKELPTRQMLEAYGERYPEMNVELVAEALQMLRRASVLSRRLESYFMEHGLTQLRFLILIVLEREPRRKTLKPREITERLDVSAPVVTRTLKSLVNDGLILMEPCPADKRAKNVRLTPNGRRALRRVLPGYYRLIEAQMKGQDT